MQRNPFPRRTLSSFIALGCLFAATLSLTLFSGLAYAASQNAAYVSLSGSFASTPAGAHLNGSHAASQQLTITLVLQASHPAQMNALLQALYTPGNPQYHHWLTQGEYNQLFAPTRAQESQVTAYLKNAGLQLASSPSPFLVRATGTTAQVETAFRTSINNYTATTGRAFFKNDTAVQIPASLSGLVIAVTGLANTDELHSDIVTTRQAAQQAGTAVPKYGAGPGGSGLTPSQTSSLYDATPIYNQGNTGKGKGATLAVFELSGYTPSDVVAYEHQFFGAGENVPLKNINVDGGPLSPVCPAGDSCGPFTEGPPCANGCDSADYSGDIEVEADLEMQISLAPEISHILVYNAPNDELGITTVDEYFKIANDDIADSVSASWGLCEHDLGLNGAEAEAPAFLQMALQGQSMFASSGDNGAFDCLEGSGYTGLGVDDPASQPLVTGVGGTSFGSYDPGSTRHPTYVQGSETVWNVLDQCSQAQEDNCVEYGAGGGGVSSLWPRQAYQFGPGVTNKYSLKGPANCVLATKNEYCREVPDVSANADEYTPYAEYCTGDPTTTSTCALFSSTQTPPGWFGIGGTSLSSPLWSAVIALWDSVHGARFGNADFGLYQLYRNSYSQDFHDVTGKHQTENNNGFYPTTPDYDLATGIGTPIIARIVDTNF